MLRLLYMNDEAKHQEEHREGIHHAVMARGALHRLLCRPPETLGKLEVLLLTWEVRKRSDPYWQDDELLGAIRDLREVCLEQIEAQRERSV